MFVTRQFLPSPRERPVIRRLGCLGILNRRQLGSNLLMDLCLSLYLSPGLATFGPRLMSTPLEKLRLWAQVPYQKTCTASRPLETTNCSKHKATKKTTQKPLIGMSWTTTTRTKHAEVPRRERSRKLLIHWPSHCLGQMHI